jgi:hypothetical protein
MCNKKNDDHLSRFLEAPLVCKRTASLKIKFHMIKLLKELEGEGRGIIMGVTLPLLLGPFYHIFF